MRNFRAIPSTRSKSQDFSPKFPSITRVLLNHLKLEKTTSVNKRAPSHWQSVNVAECHGPCCLIGGPNLAAQIAASKDSSLAPRFARALRAKMCKMGTELSHAPSRHRNITASICIRFFRIDALQSCTLFLKPI